MTHYFFCMRICVSFDCEIILKTKKYIQKSIITFSMLLTVFIPRVNILKLNSIFPDFPRFFFKIFLMTFSRESELISLRFTGTFRTKTFFRFFFKIFLMAFSRECEFIKKKYLKKRKNREIFFK